ncbi:MAG: 50S ribosomal protein L9 [Acidimicrobiia bacterium]|nr:50S ribosomal protein L9 [Acidimicrobiia bacterium]
MSTRILLRTDVDGVGKKGDIVEVADGYARNYLLPRGVAIKATPGDEVQAESMRRSRDQRDAQARAAGEEIARTLVPMVITVKSKAGEAGKLFGSVTTAEVADAVAEQAGIELDRRDLEIEEAIREVGTHAVQAKLHADVQFQITVEVVPT